ncbi:META domain-containing protein [Hyphomonas sp.]|uniref:META domain-containing protein n=1 Tax=Hyphomonas sp. TaxID=87 RepID=UPI0025BD02E8|nr:META domain-containing protein [Hyphomonas sp.]
MIQTAVRRSFFFPLVSALALTGVSACNLTPAAAPADQATTLAPSALPLVTGTATYRERMMPPPGSVLKVVLQDTSLADAPAINLAEFSAPLDEGGVPKAFSLQLVTPMDPRMTYTVRATILGPDAALLWATDTVNRVPQATVGKVDMGELLMVKVTPYEAPASPLGGGQWIIESVGGQATPGPRAPTINFGEDGRVGGFGGCNQYSGGYTQNGAKVTFTPIISTMMACAAGSIMQVESAIGAALRGDATYAINGDGKLVINSANGTEIVAGRAAANSLSGTSWAVDSIGGAAAVSGSEPSITFTADGQINGTTGCNRFFGGYAQTGSKLTFTGVGMTKMACNGDGIMLQENTFAGILSGAAAASVDGAGKLTIMGEKGVGFVAVPAASAETPPADPALLQGAAWIVEDINRGGVIDNSRLTLFFGADGRVSGSTGCNGLSGTYSVSGRKLTLSPLAMTRRACLAPALSIQESKYTGALNGELTWSITGDGALELTGDGGRRVSLRR